MTHNDTPTAPTATLAQRLVLRFNQATLSLALRFTEWRLTRLASAQDKLRHREEALAVSADRLEAELRVCSRALARL